MVGETLSHYRIVEELGRGGMGIVYKAEDTNLGRFVAIKVLPPQVVSVEEDKARFRREARAAAALSHPNIAAVYELSETDDGQIYIVMEFVDGETLADKIVRRAVDTKEAIGIAQEIAGALSVAHEAGIVHRDVKPSNIMLPRRGGAKILDFGLSKIVGAAALTKSRSTVGTAAYMSPEQARGDNADHRSDIWSLGVVLFEMLTGERPFKGEYEAAIAYNIINDDTRKISDIDPTIPSELSRIVERALEKDPDARYTSVAEMDSALGALLASTSSATGLEPLPERRRAVPLLWAILILALLTTAFYLWYQRRERILWARQVGIPEVERLAELDENTEAFQLAIEIEDVLSGEPALRELWDRFSVTLSISSVPGDADVYVRPYADHEAEWRYLGSTPIDSIRIPLEYHRYRTEKSGYVTQEVGPPYWHKSLTVELMASNSDLADMVRVEGAPASDWNFILPVGLDHVDRAPFNAFLIDRYEVTNQDYKTFVDAGGYETERYWKHEFADDGLVVSWEAAMRRFTDRTGRPSPAHWELQDYPAGQGEYPVTGISWYEAAAYAEFVGKELPTVFHWSRAAFIYASANIVPLSNLRGSGPTPVGSNEGISQYGLYDVAGNAREWTMNATGSGNEYYILGGGWDDADYGFTDAFSASAWDRSSTNGLRCALYDKPNETREALGRVLPRAFRDYANEVPVGDEEFRAILRQYEYDRTPLNAEIVATDTSARHWTREKVTFDPAYDGPTMIAYVFSPKRGHPPFQAVVMFPGSNAISSTNSEDMSPYRASGAGEFILKSGRVYVFPIYTSTYERGDDLTSDYGDQSVYYKERVIRWAQDLMRTIDYLETRSDIDTARLAYWGYSWGASNGPIMTTVETRFKASVYYVAGLYPSTVLPEADPFNFLPRVRVPTLMLNGQYDSFYPYESSQLPMYEGLGLPEGDKEYYVYEGGHYVPRDEYITKSLAWLDKYLGPVD